MSSLKVAAKMARRRKDAVRASAKPKARPATGATSSAQALKLAADLERGLVDGRLDVVSQEALQQLMAAICKTYSQQVQGGDLSLPLRQTSGVNATDIMITASALLRAVDLQVFELGMWQSWTGR
jgi:hypothetical protein